MSDFTIHLTADMIGEAGPQLSMMRSTGFAGASLRLASLTAAARSPNLPPRDEWGARDFIGQCLSNQT